jgi:DNA-binding Lrp family transcriptional regulator
MAYEATHWAWKLKLPGQRTSTTKFVLVALADMADESFSCFPGQERIATMVDCSVSTVGDAMKMLEGLGLIERKRRYTEGGYRTSDRYVLQVGKEPNAAYLASAHLGSAGDSPRLKQGLTSAQPRGITSESPEEPPVLVEEVEQGPTVTFGDFYMAYPRKVGKEAAKKAFAKAARSADPMLIVEAARKYASDPNLPEKQFIPHPATWLNRGSWDDEPLPQRDGRPTASMDDPELAWLADRS